MPFEHGGNNPEFDSVTAGGLTDSADGQKYETLREAGYEEGDIVTVATFGVGENRGLTTTSDTYIDGFVQMQLFVKWNDILPAEAETYIFYGVQGAFNTDGTPTFRMYNNTDGEALGPELTGFGNHDTGWVKYRPPTENSTIEIFPQVKSDVQGDSVTANAPTLLFGVRI